MNKNLSFPIIAACAIALIFSFGCSPGKNSPINSDQARNSAETTAEDDKKPPTFCEITKNPAQYDGKIVRIKARLSFGIENLVISGGCVDNAVATLESKEAYEPINKIREEGLRRKQNAALLDAEVEGKFINKPHTQCCTNTPFQFEITKTYSAQLVESR